MHSPPAEREREAVAGLASGRRRVLAYLRQQGTACEIGAIARGTGLHANTVRFHLERLQQDALVARETLRRGRPGRPAAVYAATSARAAPGTETRLTELAGVLADAVTRATEAPAAAAMEAGRTWGARSVSMRARPGGAVEVGTGRAGRVDATSTLVAMLAEIGFDPELAEGNGPGRAVVVQRRCPYLEVVEGRQAVVCSVHLGFMQVVLRQLDASVTADRLVPFAGPRGYEAYLSVRSFGVDVPGDPGVAGDEGGVSGDHPELGRAAG